LLKHICTDIFGHITVVLCFFSGFRGFLNFQGELDGMSQTCESHLVLLLVIFLSFRINRTVQFQFINVILSHRQGLIGSTVQPSGQFLFCYVNHRLTNPGKNTVTAPVRGRVFMLIAFAPMKSIASKTQGFAHSD
jgi:hypothetical protein